jgi:hypothetical protein
MVWTHQTSQRAGHVNQDSNVSATKNKSAKTEPGQQEEQRSAVDASPDAALASCG